MVPRLRQRLPRRAACVPVALLTVLALPAAAATLTLPPAATVLQGSSQELDVQVTVEAPTPYGVGDLLYLDADGAGTTTLGDAVLLGSRLAAPVSASDALFGHPYAGQALGRFAFVDLDDSGGLDAEDAVYACACKPLVAAGDLRLTRPAGSVGSQVRTGSPDLPPAALPTENPGSTARFQGEWAAAIKRIELGQPGNPLDDCFHLDHAILEGNPRLDRVVAGDLRLTACLGNPAGTLVQPSATAELRAALPPPASVSIRHLDANADDRYGVGDAVYATTAKTGLVGTALGSWTLRLTPAHGRAAGTLVTPNDPDLFLPASDLWGATVGFSNPDASTANGLDSLSAGDAAYLSPRFVDAGAPFPPASIRLTGRFGSQVQPGDADFWRPLQPIGGRLSFHDADGSRGFSQGDALYLQPLRRETAQQAVAPGFLRLSPVGSLGAGTFVGPSDGDTNRSVLPFSPTWSYHKPLRCLSASGLQPGVTVTFHPVCTAASASHVMVVAANGTAAPGTHTIQVRETGGTPTVAPWTFTVLANATPTPTASATGTPTESQSTSSTLTNGTSTTEGPVDLFTDLIEILAPFGAHGRLALFGAAGAVAMAATTRIKAGGRREGGQDGKEDRSEREEEREEEKEEKAEDEAPCALLHALQVTPDALEVQEESLQAGAWRKQPPAAEPGVAAHLPGKAPWRRTAVAPGAVLLELDSGEGGQPASVERGGLELTRQLRLVHGQGDCTHAFRAEAGLALTAALQAEELDGVLEVHVAVQADLQVATDSEPGSAITDFLHARCHLVDRPFRVEGRGQTRTWSLPELAPAGIAQPTALHTVLPAEHAELLSRVADLLPDAPSFQWRDVATGRFRESVTLAMGVQTARVSVRLVEGRVGRVRCALLLAALDLPFEDLECPPLKYPAWLDAAKEKAERLGKGKEFVLAFAPQSRAAQALSLLDGRLAAAGRAAGKAIDGANRSGARRLGAAGWVAVSLLLATLGFAGFTLGAVPDWASAMLAGGGLYGLLGRVWRPRQKAGSG